jgi:hypothetical protein
MPFDTILRQKSGSAAAIKKQFKVASEAAVIPELNGVI